MVEILKKRLLNPLFISAFVFALLIYSGMLRVSDRHPFKSLIPAISVTGLKGRIVSNPVLNSSGRFYAIDFSVEKSLSVLKEQIFESGSSGIVKCLLPSPMVESIYPGKLFSTFGKKMIVEKGERLVLCGSFSDGIFIVHDGEYIEQRNSINDYIVHARSISRIQFKRLMFSWKKAGGFILALLSGSREYTDKKLSDDFRSAGLSHVLALSGMHLSFFSGLAGGTGKKIFGKKYSFFLSLLGIIFFVWFAGLSPSLFRALLCSLFMILCSAVFSMEVDYFIVLCSVFLLHCSIIPRDIFSAAFILSYGALAGILLLGEFLHCLLCPFLPKKISQSVSASIGAQCATAPATIGMFGCLMPCGIISSVLVSPMASFFIFVGLVSIGVCLVLPFLAPVFGCIMNLLYEVIAVTVHFFAFVPPVKF